MTPWPPLLGAGTLPAWARARDLVLTAIAWAVLLWIMRPLLLLPWALYQAHLGRPFAPLGFEPTPNWDVLWPFLSLSAFAVALVGRHAWRRWEALRAQPGHEPEAELPLAAHARHFGVDEAQLAALRTAPNQVLHVGPDGRLMPPPV